MPNCVTRNDVGWQEWVQNASIHQDRQWIQGKTVSIKWYFFRVESTGLWYIINVPGYGSGTSVLKFSEKDGQYDWIKTDTSDLKPVFFIENGTLYLKFGNQQLTDNELLSKFSPVMAFHNGDYLPTGIEGFIDHSVLYKQNSYSDDEAVAYGQKLPDTLGYWEDIFGFSYSTFDVSDKKMSLTAFPYELNSGNVYYLDILNESFWHPSGEDTNDGFADSRGNEVVFNPYQIMADSEKKVYGRVVRQGGKIYLQYHFFYLINEWNDNGGHLIGYFDFGYHEGDWEGMIVELDDKELSKNSFTNYIKYIILQI